MLIFYIRQTTFKAFPDYGLFCNNIWITFILRHMIVHVDARVLLILYNVYIKYCTFMHIHEFYMKFRAKTIYKFIDP